MLNANVRDNMLATMVAVVTAAGDIAYATAANVLARLGIGTAGQSLQVNAGATAPQWATPPACRVYAGAGTSLTSTVNTAIAFNTEDYDTASMHSTSVNTSRITAPIAGVYAISALGTVDGTSLVANLTLRLVLNGATVIAEAICERPANTLLGGQVQTHFKLAATDYVEFWIGQDSGGTLNSVPGQKWGFAMTWVSPG